MSDLPSREEISEALTFAHITDSDGDHLIDIAQAYVEGRLVDRGATDDMEKMWVCLFDGPNDLCEQGKMTSKHQELCGEFWLLPVDAALGEA